MTTPLQRLEWPEEMELRGVSAVVGLVELRIRRSRQRILFGIVSNGLKQRIFFMHNVS